MTDRADDVSPERSGERPETAEEDLLDEEVEEATTGAVTVESYPAEEGFVLFDAENPLAWVQGTTVPLHERL